MTAYFIRRLLFVIPTFIGITIIAFFITRMVPGGPLDQAIMEFRMGAASHGIVDAGGEIPQDALDEMKKAFDLDKPWYVASFRGGANSAQRASDGGFIVCNNGGIDFTGFAKALHLDASKITYTPGPPGLQEDVTTGPVGPCVDGRARNHLIPNLQCLVIAVEDVQECSLQ